MRMAVSCLVCMLVGHAFLAGSQEAGSGPPSHCFGVARHGAQRGGGPRGTSGPLSPVDRFLDAEVPPLVSYRALRHLEAAARNGRMRASLTAITSLDPHGGFQFEILEESGSSVIRSKVLRAALEAERRARNSGEAGRSALTRLNYEFGQPEVREPGLVRVSIRPRREDAMMVDGCILLTEDQAELVSVEGRLVKRPSFWTRRVDIVRRYTRLAGVRVPISMESTADVLFAGRSTFSMRYEYEAVNTAHLSTGANR
jgi:hypothetical protein